MNRNDELEVCRAPRKNMISERYETVPPACPGHRVSIATVLPKAAAAKSFTYNISSWHVEYVIRESNIEISFNRNPSCPLRPLSDGLAPTGASSALG